MKIDAENEMFQLAVDLVTQSSRNIFLTGKAGTGKTTFLKYIRENSSKQMAIVAPTGVAAINAGGVTIHSFFQLPLLPFIPEARSEGSWAFGGSFDSEAVVNPHSLVSRLRLNSEKLKVLRELELLVIDEVSMVRCDTIDAIDVVLRHARRNHLERFGGVQVLFIGDMYQLSPVTRDDTWKILSQFYNSAYFFDSRVIREQMPLYVEFSKIYRQSDETFITLLNEVRNNQLTNAGKDILQSRYDPHFERSADDGYIVLTTHNEIVRRLNTEELNGLRGKLFTFDATIDKDFPENSFPGEAQLQLKVGAQVMFIKNDPDKARRFYNGKIGVVSAIEADRILIQCPGEADEIEVRKEKWENIRYTVNNSNRQMEEEVLGSFSQYPLRLAWAITIHKSQGLTFERAIIDVGKAFAPGQVYVALSRCTTLEGIVLRSDVNPASLTSDRKIVEFANAAISAEKLQLELIAARRSYFQQLLVSCFDYRDVFSQLADLHQYMINEERSFSPGANIALSEVLTAVDKMQQTAEKFHQWMRLQFEQPIPIEENVVLRQRVEAASGHFRKEIATLINQLLKLPVTTDSKLHAKEYNDSARAIIVELHLKQFLQAGLQTRFSITAILELKKSFTVPGFSLNVYAGAADSSSQSPHPTLHQELRRLRNAICAKRDIPVYMVAPSKTLDEMATYLPLTMDDLERISGFGKARVQAYGESFLEIIREYCIGEGLETAIDSRSSKAATSSKAKSSGSADKKPSDSKNASPATSTSTSKNTSSGTNKSSTRNTSPDKKSSTKEETLRLHREGLTPDSIASVRNLSLSTIETHLAYFIAQGKIPLDALVKWEAIAQIETAMAETPGSSLKQIKLAVGDTIGFGAIKYVMAWKEFNTTT